LKEIVYKKWSIRLLYDDLMESLTNSSIPTKYIYVQPQEFFFFYNYDFFERIDKLLIEKNSYLDIYVGFDSELDTIRYNRIKLIKWDSIDFYSKHIRFMTYIDFNDNEKVKFYEYLKKIPPKKMFTSMLSLKKKWRMLILSDFLKYKIIDYGNFSIHMPDNVVLELENKYNKELSVLKKNNFNHNKDVKNDIDNVLYISRDITQSPLLYYNYCDFEYMICAFDIVIESQPYHFFVTEKTLRAIDSMKPFVVFSCKDFHKKLKNRYNFKLYDNIIDYSFDDEDDKEERWNKIVEELIKLKRYSPEELKEITRDIALYNYENLLKIRRNNLYGIPNEFTEYYNDEYYFYKTDNNLNYVNNKNDLIEKKII
jgi:hypothetical protein